MNIVALIPGARALDFALFVDNERLPAQSGHIADYRGADKCKPALAALMKTCQRGLRKQACHQSWVVRIPFGGELFTRPAILKEETIRSLEMLVPRSPLHLPPILELLRTLQSVPAGQPVVLAFETAFFARLPQREASYALNSDMTDASAIRRSGYHGLFHAAACARACRLRKVRGCAASPRILSVCLEPQPEVAAVLRNRPVMVTSGLTPLEGLPGRTTCGELDSGIIMTLSDKMKWGPERIDRVLTRESGWLGLTGERIGLDELMTAERFEGSPGREVMTYRLLLACGAGIAAMGGLDHIVFSGRYAELGKTLGPRIITRIMTGRRLLPVEIQWDCLHQSLGRIMADQALPVLRLALSAKSNASWFKYVFG